MTEKEKMLAGVLYNSTDEILTAERAAAKEKCFKYNGLTYSDISERAELITLIFGSIKEGFCIEQPFWCDYGYRISAGKNFYMNHGCVILDAGGVTFGDNVFIGPQCGFYTSGHPAETALRNQNIEYAKAITIEDNVWIGGGAFVMPGVTIGSGSIIGGGSVVVKDVPPGVIAAGNPCRIIRRIC